MFDTENVFSINNLCIGCKNLEIDARGDFCYSGIMTSGRKNRLREKETLRLTRREDIYYIRIYLPDDIARALWREELKYSLYTHDEKLARYMKDIIALHLPARFEAVAQYHHSGFSRGQLNDYMRSTMRFIIQDMIEDAHFMTIAKWNIDGGKIKDEYADIAALIPQGHKIPDAFYELPPLPPRSV